ncbi:acyl-CoA dehydrogenase [Streptomyces populi]|uniref:Acyl-CoA dehydrogenase n=1 Tax=Streptomyces populi TaxID=2058924 RepID=A0A2I0SKD8_9ACTN|nr:acyl-CoA dehydrogenase family protein [Streptomyces populi]PKT70405.1 acyl-CoA dehydrogenase [Streptomyces populi]
MFLDWQPHQSKEYDDMLSAVRERLDRPRPPEGGLRELWRHCGELGLLGLCVPAEDGGGGRSALDTAHLIEAFGRGCADTGLVFATSAHQFACAVPISAYAGDEVRRRLLPALCDGSFIAANAMTESEAGSDISAMSARAVRDGDGYVLTGTKSWASNAPEADVFVTYAVTDPTAGFLGVSAFVVERGTAGLSVDGPFEKMGLGTCAAGSVRFEECRVPARNLLGEEGEGSAIFQHSMAWERACLFAGYVGLMDRLLERCVAHARERRQFGRRIADFQAVSHRIADMKLRLEAARMLLYRACFRLDRDEALPMDSALSKLAVSEAAVQAAVDALQIFGSRGYLVSEGLEVVLRDAIPAKLFSGTSEIQHELIAKGLGL